MTTSKRAIVLLSNIRFFCWKFTQWRGQTDEDFALSLFHIIEFRSNPLVGMLKLYYTLGLRINENSKLVSNAVIKSGRETADDKQRHGGKY